MPASTPTRASHANIARRAVDSPVGGGRLLWTARRVEVDRYLSCGRCGSPRRVVSERSIVAGQSLAHWVVVSDDCAEACAA
jgi:hypothetical protein